MTAFHPCHVCSADSDVLVRRERSVTSESRVLELPSELRLCRACGHLFTSLPLDTAAYYAEAYDATLTDEGLDELVSTRDGSVVFRTDLDYALFRRHIEGRIRATDPILEYGCGRGRILSRLVKDSFRDLTAHDLSERYREAVAPMVGSDRVFIGARPTDRRYRLAISFFVLEHDAKPVDALRYLHSVLAPEGLLYLMVPDYRTNLADLACADHVNHFSGPFLEDLLQKLGFDVLVRDDTSAVGATILLARRAERPAAPLGHNRTLRAAAHAATLPFLETLARLDSLADRLDAGRPVYLYGAGFYATLASTVLGGAGRSIAGVFDANPRKQGLERLGRVVQAPEEIAPGRHKDASLLVCVNAEVAEQVAARYAHAFGQLVLL